MSQPRVPEAAVKPPEVKLLRELERDAWATILVVYYLTIVTMLPL